MHISTLGFSLALCLAASAPAFAEDTAAVAAPVKTFQLSKVLLDTTTKEVKGKVKGGTLCVFPSKIDFPEQKKTEEYERYDVLFSDQMKKRGFDITTTSQDLFASDSTAKADFLVGATLRPDTFNVCSSVKGYKGDLLIDVEWQIFDRAAQKVVETVTTPGSSVIVKFDNNGYTLLWNQAFVASLDKLISDGVVGKYAGHDAKPVEAPAPAPVTTAAAS